MGICDTSFHLGVVLAFVLGLYAIGGLQNIYFPLFSVILQNLHGLVFIYSNCIFVKKHYDSSNTKYISMYVVQHIFIFNKILIHFNAYFQE